MKQLPLPCLIALSVCFLETSIEAARLAGADFLTFRTSPRGLALGEAYVALSDDAAGIQWNSAAMGLSDDAYLEFNHGEYIFDTRMEHGAITFPFLASDSIGLSLFFTHVDDLFATDETGFSTPVSAYDFVGTLAFAHQFSESFASGVAGKFYQSDLAGWKAEGVAIDLGLLYDWNKKVRVGASLSNLGPDIVYNKFGDPLPRWMKIGISGKVNLPWEHVVVLTSQADFPVAHQALPAGGVGVEYQVGDVIAPRVGYRFSSAEGGPRIGVGVYYRDMGFNYAYLPFDVLGGTHHMSMELTVTSEQRLKKRPGYWIEKGDKAMEDADFSVATKAYRQATLLDPEEPEPMKKLAQALTKSGERWRAIHIYEKLRKLGPLDPDADNLLAMTLKQVGDIDFGARDFASALESYNEAAELRPSDADTWRQIGWCHYHLGNRDQMKEAFAIVLSLEPGDEELRLWLEQDEMRLPRTPIDQI